MTKAYQIDAWQHVSDDNWSYKLILELLSLLDLWIPCLFSEFNELIHASFSHQPRIEILKTLAERTILLCEFTVVLKLSSEVVGVCEYLQEEFYSANAMIWSEGWKWLAEDIKCEYLVFEVEMRMLLSGMVLLSILKKKNDVVELINKRNQAIVGNLGDKTQWDELSSNSLKQWVDLSEIDLMAVEFSQDLLNLHQEFLHLILPWFPVHFANLFN